MSRRLTKMPSRSPPIHSMRRKKTSNIGRLGLAILSRFQARDQARHFGEEGVVVERQAVGTFSQHGALGPAQQDWYATRWDARRKARRSPQSSDGVGSCKDARRRSSRLRDRHFAVQWCLAADQGGCASANGLTRACRKNS